MGHVILCIYQSRDCPLTSRSLDFYPPPSAVTSSDLSRYYDQSSWFFRKAAAERARQPVLCVAPGAYDKLIVVRGVDYVVAEIKNVISEVCV